GRDQAALRDVLPQLLRGADAAVAVFVRKEFMVASPEVGEARVAAMRPHTTRGQTDRPRRDEFGGEGCRGVGVAAPFRRTRNRPLKKGVCDSALCTHSGPMLTSRTEPGPERGRAFEKCLRPGPFQYLRRDQGGDRIRGPKEAEERRGNQQPSC